MVVRWSRWSEVGRVSSGVGGVVIGSGVGVGVGGGLGCG